MLDTYLAQVRRLLQNPAAPTQLYDDVTLTADINTARGQVAAEGKCVRFMASLPLALGTRVYNFSSISLAGGTGLRVVMAVNSAWYLVASGQQWITPRAWPWFSQYSGINSPVPASGAPVMWAQFGQGVNGSLYFDPLPDTVYTVPLDTICLPTALVDDTTAEAIPEQWQDAVPYFAAYLALLQSQTTARLDYAQKMFQLYELFMQRARDQATAEVLPGQYSGTPNPTRLNQLGMTRQSPSQQQAAQ